MSVLTDNRRNECRGDDRRGWHRTDEHASEKGKRHFLVPEYGEAAVSMMRTLKQGSTQTAS
jgi:hypothetical protein